MMSQSRGGNNTAEFEAIRSAIGGGFFKIFENLYLNRSDTKGVFSSLQKAATFDEIQFSLEGEKKRIEGLRRTSSNKSLIGQYIAFLAKQSDRLSEFRQMAAEKADRLNQSFRLEKIALIDAIDIVILYKEFDALGEGDRVIPNFEQKVLAPFHELREQVKTAADPKSLLDTMKEFEFYKELLRWNQSGIVSAEQRLTALAEPYAKRQQEKEQEESFVKPGFKSVKKDILKFLSKHTSDSRLKDIKKAIEKAENPDSVIAILQLQRILYENPTEKAPDFSPLTDDLNQANKTQALSESAYKKLEICHQRVEAWINNSPVPPMVAPAASPRRAGLFGAKQPAAEQKELSFEGIKQVVLGKLPKPKANSEDAVRDFVEAIRRVKTFDELKNILELGQWLYENSDEKPDTQQFPSAVYIRGNDDSRPLPELSADFYARLIVCLEDLQQYTFSSTGQNRFRRG